MKTMPALFLGHGNPMLAVTENDLNKAWSELGRSLPRPRAVLAISAHWYDSGTRVTAMGQPRTIHDFGGFPEELYRVEYPAPGDPQLARQVAGMLSPTEVHLDETWGIDHGTWSVLRHLFPAADIPVLQLSIDRRLSPLQHYQMARRLALLRDAQIMIIASGNIVHNLAAYNWQDASAPVPIWAQEFDAQVADHLSRGWDDPLLDYSALSGAALSVPTPDHFLPLIYLCAVRRPDEPVTFPVTGFDGGSMSMRCVRFG